MIANGIYIVSADMAKKSGLIASRYRTGDGRFILDAQDLKRANYSQQELNSMVKISAAEAKSIIAKNNYAMGM